MSNPNNPEQHSGQKQNPSGGKEPDQQKKPYGDPSESKEQQKRAPGQEHSNQPGQHRNPGQDKEEDENEGNERKRA